jgi:hypothetical protein
MCAYTRVNICRKCLHAHTRASCLSLTVRKQVEDFLHHCEHENQKQGSQKYTQRSEQNGRIWTKNRRNRVGKAEMTKDFSRTEYAHDGPSERLCGTRELMLSNAHTCRAHYESVHAYMGVRIDTHTEYLGWIVQIFFSATA